ncbi:hypothetical protein HUU42_08845 [bacterium]|nr:hypothetical protein [bacterium]
MNIFENLDLNLLLFNIIVVAAVVYSIVIELSAILNYLARTSGKDGFFVTRIHRPSVRIYFILFLITTLIALFLQFFAEDAYSTLAALVALIVGFVFYSYIYQVCFINNVGIGGVSPRQEMEIQWNEIDAYEWKENVLHLTLKKKILSRRTFKFYDSHAMVEVNERLRRLTPVADIVQPGSLNQI